MVQVIDWIGGYPWFVPEEPYRADAHELVSNKPFREEFERRQHYYGTTASDLALDLGWYRSRRDQRPDAARVLRALGLACDAGRDEPRKTTTYGVAAQLAIALDLSPHDAGV